MVAHGLEDSEIVRLAIALYSLFRTVNAIRFARHAQEALDPAQLLRLYAKKALNQRTREVLQATHPSPEHHH